LGSDNARFMDQMADATKYLGLLDWLYLHYGSNVTLAIILGAPAVFVAIQVWREWRKEADVKLALQEKDRTIDRLASENRMYRVTLFKDKLGWTDEQIERFLIKGDTSHVPEKKGGKK
jgi:hypothetical protein